MTTLDEATFDEQIKRLPALFAPGVPEDRFDGWMLEMRDLFRDLPYVVLVRAVDLALRRAERIPVPKHFQAFVDLARQQIPRAVESALPPLTSYPLPDSPGSLAAKQEARRLLDSYRQRRRPGVADTARRKLDDEIAEMRHQNKRTPQ